jgi:hypothetical protein
MLSKGPAFTAITRVQIPSGRQIKSRTCSDLRLTFGGAKSHISVPLLHPQHDRVLRYPDDGIFFCGVSDREEQCEHSGLRGVLGRRDCLGIDIHRRS